MQGKVSMVMPCYNKVKYIAEMFDSILAQEWDNIELILVNDGSTDGTRDVIAEYEPRFRLRGFEVVIEDQLNAGVCAAAKAGLALATGDYICMVDSDDELDPKYVSIMAGWLDDHAEYDYCICDAALYTGSGINKNFKPLHFSELQSEEPLYTERYLLADIRSEVWVYLVRAEYLNKCNIVNTYYTDSKGSHEPGYIIPLTMNRGKYKYFPLALYHFNVGDIGHSHHVKFEQAHRFYEEYNRLCNIAVNYLPSNVADSNKKKQIMNISLLSKHIHLYQHARKLTDGHLYLEQSLDQLIKTINTVCETSAPVKKDYIYGRDELFIHALKNKVLGVSSTNVVPITSQSRIIGYGALGKAATALIPLLKYTPLEPTELWDTLGDGEVIKRPNFSTLTKMDIVLVFPKAEQVLSYVKGNSTCIVLSTIDIERYLSHYLKEKYLS